MDFELDDVEQIVQKTAYQFAMKDLAPRAARADDDPSFCDGSLELLARNGYLGLVIPEQYGGEGMTSFHYVLAKEQIARVCLSTGAISGAHNLAVYCLLLMGNEAQKERYLPQLASGERVGAFALTEANTGSDVVSIAARAIREGDAYILNGSKQFITNGGKAGLIVAFSKTDPSQGHRGITAFLVERETPGFSVAKEENKMGIRGTSTGQLSFDNCRVPAENRLGEEGAGFKLSMMVLDRARPSVGAQALGVAQAALDMALSYAQERQVFGKPLSEQQAIRFALADMATRLEAARLLVYRAAKIASKGVGRFSKESSMAKLYASETAHFIVDKALQIHGGYGYMKDYAIERLYRDQRILEIYEGTSEIQRMVIAGNLIK
jgi:alkylation response protein AidB-like acyl-CoA dehydrogenase